MRFFILFLMLTMITTCPQFSYAQTCSEKFPLKKIVVTKYISVPYEAVVLTPIEVGYFILVKTPYKVAATCFKKPNLLVLLNPTALIPFACSKTGYKMVKDKRYRKEFKKEVVQKIKKVATNIEEVVRPVGYATCLADISVKEIQKINHDIADRVIDLQQA